MKVVLLMLLMLLFVVSTTPVLASRHRANQESGGAGFVETSTISCETVRSYVRQIGLVQARALARANRMTPSQEWRARQCLAKRD